MKDATLYFANDGKEFKTIGACKRHNTIINKKRKAEIKQISDDFLKSVGFDVDNFKTIADCNRAMHNMWIVFDKFGNVNGLKTCGMDDEEYGIKCDFRYVSGKEIDNPEIMSNWLRENKLYAHALSSFVERSPEFYALNFINKLEYLGWDIKDGHLIKTAW